MKRPLLPATNPNAQTGRAQPLEGFGDIDPLPAGVHAVHLAPIGFPDFKTAHGYALSIAGFKVTVAIMLVLSFHPVVSLH